MISESAKQLIETRAREIVASNGFFSGAKLGTIKKEQVELYLHNLFFLFKETTFCLSLAKRRALELNDSELGAFFNHKAVEEFGHDQWAKMDLENLGTKLADVDPTRVTRSMTALAKYIRALIARDPKLYLLYMYFAEYITVLAGPEFLNDLERNCGIAKSNMTSLSNHCELDVEHAQEDAEVLDKFIGNPAHPEEYLDVINTSAQFLNLFLNEIVAFKTQEREAQL